MTLLKSTAVAVVLFGPVAAAFAGTGAELLHGAWIDPDLGSPDQTEPRSRMAGAAVGPIVTAVVLPNPPARASAPADLSPEAPRGAKGEAPPKLSASGTKAAPGGGTSLRERLAARSYKNDDGHGKATAGSAAGALAVRHTEAFVEAMKKIDEMAKAKAANPSQAIGPYFGSATALKNASVLPPRGYGYYYQAHDTNFGTDQMVFGLMETFALMADLYPDNTPVVVGDIGLQSGGPIDGHISHRNGRDVDIGLFGVTDGGKPANGFNSYDAQGMRGRLRFDAARNWDYACTHFESRHYKVVCILLWQPLKDLLLAHARGLQAKVRSDAEAQRLAKLIKDAEALIQDGGTEHSNHFHLRIQ